MFGEKLKTIRKGKKIKQKDLADTLGMSQTHLCQLENGKSSPTLNTLSEWCKSMDCELRVLIKDD